ncbi:MAG: hypothetical protein HS113_07185 [Verrucomicrobiales bacterium]|nr:hypothetical protein [Verrucomicrobiales bacterium]
MPRASTLLAPVLMLCHTAFIIDVLCGTNVGWGKQSRAAQEALAFGTALRLHRWHTLLGVAWGIVAWVYSPVFLAWLSPLLFGMIFAAPLSWLLSSPALGAWLRRRGLLLVPEEQRVPPEAEAIASYAPALEAELAQRPLAHGALAVLDPKINALHVAALRQPSSPTLEPPSAAPARAPATSLDRARCQGLDALAPQELWVLLNDPGAMVALHHAVWREPNLPLDGWILRGIRPR